MDTHFAYNEFAITYYYHFFFMDLRQWNKLKKPLKISQKLKKQKKKSRKN